MSNASMTQTKSTKPSNTVPLKRKAHRKSRTGCSTCKRRRIKCDEDKPRCSHCVRHGVTCLYPEVAERNWSTRPTSPASQSTPKSALTACSTPALPFAAVNVSPPISSQSSFSLKDMALLHHWTMKTSSSIVNEPKVDYLWQTVFPEIAYRHSYVMQGLLSLAALHIAYLQPDDRQTHLHIAAHHHTLALSGLRQDMYAICPENADAVFASATLMFLYAFTTFSKLSDELEEDGADTAVRKSRILGADWIPLVHGVRVVIGPTHEYLRAGPLRSVLGVQGWDEVDPDVHPAPDDAHMLKIKETWQDDDNKEVYDETLHTLRKASAWVSRYQSLPNDAQDDWGYNRDWSAPFIWLSVVPKEYFKLQRQRQPLALLIFAYFGVLLHQLYRHWWTDSCGKSIVGVVDDCLGPYWAEWMAWPKQVVGLD